MPFLSIFPKRNKKKEIFLVFDIGLERVSAALFKTTEDGPQLSSVGRKNFSSQENIFDACLDALDALSSMVEDLPKETILGVSGGLMRTVTTKATYTRPSPKEEISEEEVSKVLEEVSEKADEKSFETFFSTVSKATIDGAKVSNPVGLKGENIVFYTFIAYKPKKELAIFDKLIEEADLKLEKVIPTSFALSQELLKKGIENAMILRVGNSRSEAAILNKGYLNEIVPFDLGVSSPDLWLVGFESVLEKQLEEGAPTHLWIFPDHNEVSVEEVKENLSNYAWSKHGVHKMPKIETVFPDQDSAEDGSLIALAKQEVV